MKEVAKDKVTFYEFQEYIKHIYLSYMVTVEPLSLA